MKYIAILSMSFFLIISDLHGQSHLYVKKSLQGKKETVKSNTIEVEVLKQNSTHKITLDDNIKLITNTNEDLTVSFSTGTHIQLLENSNLLIIDANGKIKTGNVPEIVKMEDTKLVLSIQNGTFKIHNTKSNLVLNTMLCNLILNSGSFIVEVKNNSVSCLVVAGSGTVKDAFSKRTEDLPSATTTQISLAPRFAGKAMDNRKQIFISTDKISQLSEYSSFIADIVELEDTVRFLNTGTDVIGFSIK